MAANEDKLNALHEKITDLFLEIVECGEDIPSATLKTMTSFLKDNEITCQDDKTSIGDLKTALKRKRLQSVPHVSDPMEAFH
jgi:hypothetical protein